MTKKVDIFPWWQSGHYLVSGAGPAAGTRFYFRRKQTAVAAYRNDNKALFINSQPWPVFIDEIRLFTYSVNANATATYQMGRFGFRMRNERYGEIFSEFMVGYALGYSDPIRVSAQTAKRGGKMTLPQPFRISAEQALSLKLRAPATSDVTGFQAGIRGKDPYNRCPVIRANEPVAVAAGGAPVDVALVSNRDKNVKAIDVEDVTFSIYGGSDTSVRFFWDLEVSIEPSYGPMWTDDASTQLELILDRVRPEFYGRNAVVFTPPSPYILLPGEQFFIEGQALEANAFGENGGQVSAVLMGHQEVPIDYYR